MKRAIFSGVSAAIGLLLIVACNNVGTCPAASSIKPGASCTGDSLTCAYVQMPDPSCGPSGADAGVPTSCTCTGGVWVCPDVTTCEGGPGDDGGGDATTDDGGGDATVGDGEAGTDSSVAEAGDDGSTSDSSSAETGGDTGTGEASSSDGGDASTD